VRGRCSAARSENGRGHLANGLSQIVGYRVGADGSLTQVTTAAAAAGSGGIGAG
jgi:hypothetical protein